MFSFIKKLFRPSLLEECERGDVDAVNQCISDGQDVNMKDTDGRSSLLVAAMKGHKAIVEILLAKGADVNAGDVDGSTPLDGGRAAGRARTVGSSEVHSSSAGLSASAVSLVPSSS